MKSGKWFSLFVMGGVVLGLGYSDPCDASGEKTQEIKQSFESTDGIEPESYHRKGSTREDDYLFPVEKKMLKELEAHGVVVEETEVELHAINGGEEPLSLGQLKTVEVCGGSGCHPVPLVNFTGRTLAPALDGSSMTLGKATIKSDTFTHLKVRVRGLGGKDAEELLPFRKPLNARLLAKSMKVLLSVDRKADCAGNECLKLLSASSLEGYEGAEYLYYSPRKGARKMFRDHVSVTLPPGMLTRAEIFSVMIRDTGGRYPYVEVMPRLNLTRPMRLEIPPYDAGRVRYKGIGNSTESTPSVVKEVMNPVDILDDRTREEAEGDRNKSFIKKGAINSCIDTLNSQEFREKVNNVLWSTGLFYEDNLCQNIAPHVHIAVTRTAGNGRYYDALFQLDGWVTGGARVRLKRVNEYAGFNVVINGFTWSGSFGAFEGDTGYPRGM